jgi:tetratricopeptide (TPR) repeat protein
LNVRIAIHYGLIAPPEATNYIDSNLNLAARIEGATPPNTVCISSVVHDIVADTLRQYSFTSMAADLKGLGQTRFYSVQHEAEMVPNTNDETRLDFYLSTIDTLRQAEKWEAVRDVCRQALVDFPDNPEFLFQHAYAALLLGDSETTVADFGKAAGLNYNREDSLYFVGCAYADQGDEELAIEQFDAVLREYSSNYHAMLQLAEIYFARRDFTTAWMWAERAANKAPRFYEPRALQIALTFALKNEIPVESLVRGIPARNKRRFREAITRYLQEGELFEDDASIDSAFALVFNVARPALKNH